MAKLGQAKTETELSKPVSRTVKNVKKANKIKVKNSAREASQASRCASSELNSRSRLCSVNFRALRHPRRDAVLVAAAGPGINIALAFLAAEGFHVLGYLPSTVAQWVAVSMSACPA